LFEGRSSSLESGRKTKKPRRAQPAGFTTLGLYCRPYQDAAPRQSWAEVLYCRPYQDAEPSEAILGEAKGFTTLGLYCRPYQDAEPSEAILGEDGDHYRRAAQPAVPPLTFFHMLQVVRYISTPTLQFSCFLQ
jgi:hypothetical protein